MNRRPVIKVLFFLLCSSKIALVFSQADATDLYPAVDKSSCAFPFIYRDNFYYDCTIDGDNGDIPWCSLTNDYKGLIIYCYDFRNTTIQCLPSFTMPNGKTYYTCDYLSATSIYKQCKTNNAKIKYRYCTDALENNRTISLKRNDNCDPNYARLAVDHTMCYGPSPYANIVPFTPTEIQDILDMHNSYRAAVSSRYMFKLYWDDELAKLAQAHANLCAFEHDLAVNRLSPKFNWTNGQNIVMSSEIRSTPASLIDMMLSSEQENFHYGKPCSPGDNTCLHYTQAMLSDLTRVGCGQTHCVYPDRIERFVTCNYIQSQYEDNYQTPYIESDISTIDCPSKAKGGLCDCGNKICSYNLGEFLDPNQCFCRQPLFKRSIQKPDRNDAELQKYASQDVISAAGKVNFLKRDKRTLKYLKNNPVSKRSIQKPDRNDAELQKYASQDVISAAGKINFLSRHERGIKFLTDHGTDKQDSS